jgi:hypothetical protein
MGFISRIFTPSGGGGAAPVPPPVPTPAPIAPPPTPPPAPAAATPPPQFQPGATPGQKSQLGAVSATTLLGAAATSGQKGTKTLLG